VVKCGNLLIEYVMASTMLVLERLPNSVFIIHCKRTAVTPFSRGETEDHISLTYLPKVIPLLRGTARI
jgi:hypothetical protein